MKSAAIMQPYFFPYIGYFGLIKHTDQFILFDPVQFIRHGWIERNRILKQDEGWLYIKAPLVKPSRDTLIQDVRLDNSEAWQSKIVAQLQVYKKTAPYYQPTMALIERVLSAEYADIVTLNQASLSAVCAYLGINRNLEVYSKMGLNIAEPTAPDEWALNICQALGDVGKYLNAPGGEDFFDRSKYERGGIELAFLHQASAVYDQRRSPFEPGLSIIDTMMFNTPAEINHMIDDYELS